MFKNKFIVLFLLLTVLMTACIACEPKDDPSGDDGTTGDGSGSKAIMDLPPMKDQFAEHFLIGNIYSGASSNWNWLERHYNAITAENIMKPYALAGNLNTSNNVVTPDAGGISAAKNFVDKAIESGHKVIGHTLLWHNQNANWNQSNYITTLPAHGGNESIRQNNIEIMKSYITAVAGHSAFKGRIYSWDVLNEVFPDSGYNASSDWKAVMRSNNPWFRAIGSDFVYEGFLAARNADPTAILYYNDYNTDQVAKATMIRNMVRDVNARYAEAYPSDTRKLIEGIGMQEHHNTNVSASAVKNTITLFRPLGVKLAVTELDVLAQGYKDEFGNPGPGKPPASGNNLTLQAQRYGEYFKVYLDNSDIIERVSFWGITDNQSWRSPAQPLIFDNNGNAKDAYYKVIEALGK